MSPIQCEIAVVGAGVLGLSVGAELTACGRDVLVVDAGRLNASAVAAGMIAPAFESLLDHVDDARAALLRDAAALWPDFAERHGLSLDTTPAEWRGPEAQDVADALIGLGFSVERDGEVVRVACDHRIEPSAALKRLRDWLARDVLAADVTGVERLNSLWRVRTTAGDVEASHLVLATGAAAALPGLPDQVMSLVDTIEPIAGQIGRSHSPLTERVVRGTGGYVVPNRSGALIGATMVHGSRDTTPDSDASARLEAAATRLLGQDLPAGIQWRGGVRGATADGLPLVGPVGAGLHLALAPRRNGWLLGPLVGRILADGIEGRPRGDHAAALDPSRFSPLAG